MGSTVGVKLKQLRQDNEMSLKDVSEGTGISVSMISKIEREESTPTIDLVIRLARFFNISLAEMTNISTEIRVGKHKTDELMKIESSSGAIIEFLSRYNPDSKADFFRLIIPPGKSFAEESVHPTGSYHVLLCHQGKGDLIINGDRLDFSEGDVLSFYSDAPHDYENRGDGDLVIIGILTYK